ncbi:F0F1 ATP synthase subunit epsilon [Epidermidibacterium keratini]|uniref:ATP synthase epsilon chain n=1 Tax=Epidermidibacterium keratini TaxID=1891644 RepID=A0A7L4YT49_9ACTN|nr:F0F1 ATP synthase subunit epsilon [Epidermidibacterium keratini]QHC01707.1 F0F1 ATP synthase subunit epsilon [Epidermidibacterium keratini]
MALHVELVAVERLLWSGDAQMVVARTTEGEMGVLPGHAPVLAQLAEPGTVRIQREGAETMVLAVHGGFLSVTEKGVSILAEYAELADEIDVERARAALSRAEGDDEAHEARARAESRLMAVEHNRT